MDGAREQRGREETSERASHLFSDRRIALDDEDNCRMLLQQNLSDVCRRDLFAKTTMDFDLDPWNPEG